MYIRRPRCAVDRTLFQLAAMHRCFGGQLTRPLLLDQLNSLVFLNGRCQLRLAGPFSCHASARRRGPAALTHVALLVPALAAKSEPLPPTPADRNTVVAVGVPPPRWRTGAPTAASQAVFCRRAVPAVPPLAGGDRLHAALEPARPGIPAPVDRVCTRADLLSGTAVAAVVAICSTLAASFSLSPLRLPPLLPFTTCPLGRLPSCRPASASRRRGALASRRPLMGTRRGANDTRSRS